jgi:tetratricopeptide (TPR) repeat protein
MQQQTLECLLMDRSQLLRGVENFPASLADLAEAERIAAYWHDLAGAARCKMYQAEIVGLTNGQSSAVGLYRAAIAAAKSAGSCEVVADAASLGGRALFEIGRIDEARMMQEDAIAFCAGHKNYVGLGTLHNNLGLICAHLNLVPEALKNYQECERWYRQLEADAPAYELGRALGNQAELLEKLGRSREALSRYREAAKWFAVAEDGDLELAALSALSVCLSEGFDDPTLSDERLEEAETVMLRVLELSSTNSSTSPESLVTSAKNTVAVLMRRAVRLRQLARSDEAGRRFTRAREVAREYGLKTLEQAIGAIERS